MFTNYQRVLIWILSPNLIINFFMSEEGGGGSQAAVNVRRLSVLFCVAPMRYFTIHLHLSLFVLPCFSVYMFPYSHMYGPPSIHTHMGPFPQDGNWPWVMWLFQKVWMVAVTKCEEQRLFFNWLWEIFFTKVLWKKYGSVWHH